MLPPKSRILRPRQTGWPSSSSKYGNCVWRVETRFHENVFTGANKCFAMSVSSCASCVDIGKRSVDPVFIPFHLSRACETTGQRGLELCLGRPGEFLL